MNIRRREFVLTAFPAALSLSSLCAVAPDAVRACLVTGEQLRHVDIADIFDELGLRYTLATLMDIEKIDLAPFELLWFACSSYPYPAEFSKKVLDQIESRLAAGAGVFAEFALNFPGVPASRAIHKTGVARLYVSGALDPGWSSLPAGTILDEHDSVCLSLTAESNLRRILSFGKVLGVEILAQDPKIEDTWAGLLWGERAQGRFAAAATNLSDFRRREYAPAFHWEQFLTGLVLALLPAEKRRQILAAYIPCRAYTLPRAWIMPGTTYRFCIDSRPGLRVALRLGQPLDETSPGHYEMEMRAAGPGSARFRGAIHAGDALRSFEFETMVASRDQAYRAALERNIRWFEESGVLLRPDGSLGVAEWISGPDIDGNRIPYGKGQMFSPVRADCVFESGLAFWLYGNLASSDRHRHIGRNMLAAVMDFQRLDRDDEQYGLWYTRGRSGPPWEDDIAWATIGCLAAHRYIGNPMFRERGIVSADASARYALTPAGAQDDHEPHPHDRGHLLASWLYTYGATGDRHYLDMALPPLRRMVERFPKINKFLISRTAEAARFLLPLAMAYAYTGDRFFSAALKQQAAYLESRMAPCGAIQEDRSNTGARTTGTDLGLTYDANETISDQLYTTSFASMNLWIAHQVTRDPSYLDLFHRVTDYLIRIQVRAAKPEIDGGWMRGFDYSLWEYYGSNADQSWTTYTLETGWTNAIIDIALALCLTGDSFLPGTNL